MKKLLLFTMALVILCFSPAHATDTNTVKAAIIKHAIELGVDPAIALSIARTESGFNHNARSNHGAVGVFQLMPSTARRMGYNPYSLNENIKAGITYYKSMYKMFGSVELALAAYNAGPGNVQRYKSVPPFAETKRFVSKIMQDYHYYKADPAVAKAKSAVANKAAATNKPAATAKPVTTATKPATSAPAKPTATATAAPAKPPQPAPMLVQAKDVHAKVEVVDETPIELEIEATSLAI